jgi:translation initiation factor IF-1
VASAVTTSNGDEVAREVTVEVTPYDPSRGVVSSWDEDTVLRVELDDSPEPTAVISGNRVGLTSLARHLLTLAQGDTPVGSHLDFDSYCGWFEEGSAAIRIELE